MKQKIFTSPMVIWAVNLLLMSSCYLILGVIEGLELMID